jgi:hypothetical protein
VGAVLWAILLLGGGLAMFVSVMFFSAGVDSRGSDPCGARSQANTAALVLCGGVVLACLIAFVGTVVSATRNRWFSYWALLGVLLAAASIWLGFDIVVAAGFGTD